LYFVEYTGVNSFLKMLAS